jgi:cytochrome c oxidase subunit II
VNEDVYQHIAWNLTLFFVSVMILTFGFIVARSAGKKADYDPIVKKAYRIRTIFFWVLIVGLLPTAIYTISKNPYSLPASAQSTAPQVVKAVGQQFGWNLSSKEFKVGQPVEFDVTSTDVNHGFGIYDENMHLLAQTQAMPDYTNKLYYTFQKPGTYQILCLEYCGVGHHVMIAKVTVKPNGGLAYEGTSKTN